MRYLLIIFLAACTFLPRAPEPSIVYPVSPPIEINAPREDEQPKEQRQKPKINLPATVSVGTPPCIDLDTDDLKESINLKLKCIDETLK
jgi:hypothetical protein